jgi:hypothetical protein
VRAHKVAFGQAGQTPFRPAKYDRQGTRGVGEEARTESGPMPFSNRTGRTLRKVYEDDQTLLEEKLLSVHQRPLGECSRHYLALRLPSCHWRDWSSAIDSRRSSINTNEEKLDTEHLSNLEIGAIFDIMAVTVIQHHLATAA